MGDRWSMGGSSTCKGPGLRLPGPQERRKVVSSLHGQRQMEQGIAWAGPGDHFTAGEAEAWRKEEPC